MHREKGQARFASYICRTVSNWLGFSEPKYTPLKGKKKFTHFYLKGRFAETEKEERQREGEILHLLVHFPNASNG